MKTIDLIKKIQECKTPDQLIDLQNELPGYNVGFDLEKMEAFVIKDYRLDIKRRLAEEHASILQLAKWVEMDYSSLKSFLRGERECPFKYFQKIAGLLQL